MELLASLPCLQIYSFTCGQETPPVVARQWLIRMTWAFPLSSGTHVSGTPGRHCFPAAHHADAGGFLRGMACFEVRTQLALQSGRAWGAPLCRLLCHVGSLSCHVCVPIGHGVGWRHFIPLSRTPMWSQMANVCACGGGHGGVALLGYSHGIGMKAAPGMCLPARLDMAYMVHYFTCFTLCRIWQERQLCSGTFMYCFHGLCQASVQNIITWVTSLAVCSAGICSWGHVCSSCHFID